jgi:hypothetical protein
MKHPVRSDFHTVVDEASVTVTFKPSFYGLAGADDIARLGPFSFKLTLRRYSIGSDDVIE